MSEESILSFTDILKTHLGGELPNILMALIILVVGLIVAKWVSKFVTGVIRKTGLTKYLESIGSKEDIPSFIGNLVYYIIILNLLLIVLGILDITSVLDPLKNLSDQFLGALPRIIGAGIIFYAGWVIAKIVASFVEIASHKLDQELEKRNFNPDFKISKFLSAFVFGGVLLPIIVGGFEFLQIRAISEPAISMITSFMSSVPNIVGAALILLVAYYIGKFVVYMLSGLLEGMNIDQIPEKMGMNDFMPKGTSLVDLIGKVVMFFFMLTATTAAVEKLNIDVVSNIFSKMIDFAGGVVLGSVILMIGTFLANLAYKKLNSSKESGHLAGIARFAILGLVLAMGLRAMGLADNIVNMAFAFTFGAVAVAVALSFGLGGKEAAQEVTKKWVSQFKK